MREVRQIDGRVNAAEWRDKQPDERPLIWHDSRQILLLLCKVLLLALINRYWLVPRFRLAGRGTQQKFTRMTQLELLLACGGGDW